MTSRFNSWGRYPDVDQDGVFLPDRHALLPGYDCLLPFGNGRSYGDVCLNPGGMVVSSQRLDRFIAFDEESGCLRCEAGVLLAD
ncbi:MAG TPA: FAD-binding protein, partial [Gammaproteobacteria bacterium]